MTLFARRLFFGVALSAMLVPVYGQKMKRTANKLSPPAETSASFAGKSVTVAYSAPSLRNRSLESLVPEGKVWRAGADEATTLFTDATLTFGTTQVPKGTYTLYVMPENEGATLIINKQTGQWGTEYNKDQDLGRVPMTLQGNQPMQEKFTITVEKVNDKSGVLKMAWGDRLASAAFTAQ